MVVIADLPPDVRSALAAAFTLVERRLESASAVRFSNLPPHTQAVVTRAVLGVPAGLIEALP